MSLRILDDDNSIVNHQTCCQCDPEQSQRINGEIEDLDEGERANQRDRNSHRRNDGGPPIQQEQEDHDDDDQDRLFQRRYHFADRVADNRRRIECNDVLDSWREGLRQLRQLSPCGLVDGQRIGVRQLLHTDADGVVPAVKQVGVVGLRANLCSPNIFQLNDAVLGVLDDDVFELDRIGQSPHHAQSDLKVLLRVGRRTSQLTCWDLDVLFLECRYHIGSGQLSGCQLRRVKPDAHRVLTFTKDDYIAHTGYALQRVLHVHVEVVRDVLVGKAVVRRIESGGKDKVGIRLCNRDAGVLDLLRQASLSGRDTVLHVNRCDIEIVTGAEGYIDCAGAVVGTRRGNVVHALDAVDLLLERYRYRRLHHLRIGTHVVAGDGDLRRREVRVERDRQRRDADGTRQNDQQSANGRKNGPLDKEINQCSSRLLPQPWAQDERFGSD